MIYFVSHHFNFGKIWKTTFPEEFFNEIWVITGDYEYINIAEIKIVKVFFVLFCFVLFFSGGILVENPYFPASPKF